MTMSTGQTAAVVGGVLAVAALGIGIGVAVAKGKDTTGGTSPPPPPPPPPPALPPCGDFGKVTWTRTTQINKGDHVRASLGPADWATIAKQVGVSPDLAGLKAFLERADVQKALGNVAVSLWPPGAIPCADWPADDTDAANEFHLEIAQAPVAFDTSKFAVPALKAWTAPSMGAIPPQTIWTKSSSIKGGQLVRVSMAAGDWSSLAKRLGLTPDAAGWQGLIGNPFWQAIFGTSVVIVYAPGEALPQDWPPDDPSAAQEYHAQFVYPTGSPELQVGMLPLSALAVSVWTRDTATPPPGM